MLGVIELTVYLAGGFRSRWQEKAIKRLRGWKVLDPSEHGLEDPRGYTDWDLRSISAADVVLAYMEEGNPGGYSLALEVGYAKALRKRILFVEEGLSGERRKYFDMVREVADKTFDSLDSCLTYLVQVGERAAQGRSDLFVQ